MSESDTVLKPEFDPNLKAAAEEFNAICKKYDVAGIANFVSSTHTHFAQYLSPSWSICRFEEGKGYRLRSEREDFESVDAQMKATNATAHMLASFIEWSERVQEAMGGTITQLRGLMKVIWTAQGKAVLLPSESETQ